MRIHELTIEGFGPFKDRQHIDFDALSQDRIFMLEGPTGAGKSSIIDAIVYALYGVTAHEAATKSGPAGGRVRSDYCEPTDETRVSMEFTTGGSRYRVVRTAAYEVPKQNGSGNRQINAKATLEFINPPYEAINQVREVNIRLEEELRMNHEQFSQMVVLPQGDFASFLHATSEDRRKVLEKVFKTFFYDNIKSDLDAKSKEIESQISLTEEDIRHHVRNLQGEWREGVAEIDFLELEKLLTDANASRSTQDEVLQNVVIDLRPDGEKDIEEKTKLEKELDPLIASLTSLRDSSEKIQVKAELETELANLLENASQIQVFESQLRIKQQASGLIALIDGRNSAAEEQEAALEQIPEEYVELTSVQVKARIKALGSVMPALSKAAEEAESASEELEDIDDAIESSVEIEAAIKNLPVLQKNKETLEKKVSTASTKLKEYRRGQKNDAIFEAVKLLKKGQACPVCGSKDHPKPLKGDGAFDENHLAELELDFSNLEYDLNEIKGDLRQANSLAGKKFKPSAELKKKKRELEKRNLKADSIVEEFTLAKQELDDMNNYLEYFITYERAEKLVKSSQIKIDVEMKKLKLESEEAAIEISLLDEEKLAIKVTAHRDRVTEINSLLKQEEYKKLPDSETLDEQISTLEEKATTLTGTLTEVSSRLAVLDRINESLDQALKGIEQSLDSAQAIRDKGGSYLKLQDWVSGKNLDNLSLTNFVLQERLEMILEYASRHLRRISNGKYEFRLFEEKQGRNRKAGLGITVMDYFAGKERPAETLSGGETFYASLALALGLVEVVKADNGGIELGTLFIDEGFGSLSDDTLEEVLDVLEDLRAERVIGIISHVEGMKTQIPMRLEVRRTDEGPSFVKMALGGMN